MFSIKTLLSVFNEKGTLLKWLQNLENAYNNAALKAVEILPQSATTVKLNFIFNDNTNIESDIITLPQGEPGKDGVTPVITATAFAVTAEKGEPADVRVTPTSSAPNNYNFQFDFDIPEGEKGEKGEPGNGITDITTQGSRDTGDGYTETEVDIETNDFSKTVKILAKNGGGINIDPVTVTFELTSGYLLVDYYGVDGKHTSKTITTTGNTQIQMLPLPFYVSTFAQYNFIKINNTAGLVYINQPQPAAGSVFAGIALERNLTISVTVS